MNGVVSQEGCSSAGELGSPKIGNLLPPAVPRRAAFAHGTFVINRKGLMVMRRMIGVLLVGLLGATLMLTGCGDDGDGPAEIGAFVLNECRLDDPACRLQ